MTYLLAAGVLLVPACSSPSASQAEPAPAPAGQTAAVIPAEVTTNWEQLVGTWVADNSAYKSDQDPFDGFGLEWSWGIDRKSVVGRLYGIQDGQEAGTFWEFREYWHPGDQTLVTMQFGVGGTFGVGPHEHQGEGRSEMLQTFYRPADGVVFRVGHRSVLRGDEQLTESFDVDEAGAWTPRRSYTWSRQAPDASSGS